MKFGKQLVETVGSGVAGGVAGAIGQNLAYTINKNTGYLDEMAERQLKQQDSLNKNQWKYNKEAMQYSNELQKEMFDYTSPKKRRQQLEEAGLNPALMYGQGGGGVSAMGGPAAVGVGGSHASDEAARKQTDIQSASMGIMLQKAQSEIELNKSIAKKNIADAELTAGADTDKRKAEIELLFKEAEIAENNAWISKIDADFAFQMRKALIDNIISNKDVNIQQKDYVKNTIDLTSSNIRKIDQEINNLKKQENLTDEQVKLVKEQVAQITANIMQKWEELRLKGESIGVQREQIEALIENNIRDNETKVGVGKLQKSSTIMGGVQTILNEGVLKPLFKNDYNSSIMK